MDADKLRKHHPEWFKQETTLGRALRKYKEAEAKKALLAMNEGAARPPEGISYDPNFAAKIRERHPNWFRK